MAFGNRGGRSKNGPKYRHQCTVPVDDADFEYLSKMKRLRGGSLADQLRCCIAHCRDTDALQLGPRFVTPDYFASAAE